MAQTQSIPVKVYRSGATHGARVGASAGRQRRQMSRKSAAAPDPFAGITVHAYRNGVALVTDGSRCTAVASEQLTEGVAALCAEQRAERWQPATDRRNNLRRPTLARPRARDPVMRAVRRSPRSAAAVRIKR